MNIQEIAKLAGVSAATVSKITNGKDQDISEETKNRVLKIIEEEQYVPYSKYRERSGRASRMIGLIVRRENREREAMIMGAEHAAKEKGYSLLVDVVDSEEEILKSAEEIGKKKVSGIIIDSADYFSIKDIEDAIIWLNNSEKHDSRQKACFYYTLTDAAQKATEQLIKAGHERIACMVLSGEDQVISGYKAAMSIMSLPVQPQWICVGDSLQDIERYGIRQCLSGSITAVVCASPQIACTLYKVACEIHLEIPEGISVVTVGDSEFSEIIGNGVTSIRLPAEEMAIEAVQYLTEAISLKRPVEGVKRFFPSVILRNSIISLARGRQREKIVVVGTMNIDVYLDVARIPVNGETQIAEKLSEFPGGKGGNQAVGVGKLGGRAYMIGCIGNDEDGRCLYDSLVENHVHMDGVLFSPSLPSGKAFVNVDRGGESTIVVHRGANRSLSVKQIEAQKKLFREARYCLLSMELPMSIIEFTIEFCKKNNTEVIIKPAAAEGLDPRILSKIDYFVPNEKELDDFVPDSGAPMREKANYLLNQGVRNVIVTLGEKGCYLKNRKTERYFAAADFEAVDTTGGADSFISAMAEYLCEGRTLEEAIEFAIYASGMTVTKYGVQPALPMREALSTFEDQIRSKYM